MSQNDIPDVVQESFIKAYRSGLIFSWWQCFHMAISNRRHTAKNYLTAQDAPPNEDILAKRRKLWKWAVTWDVIPGKWNVIQWIKENCMLIINGLQEDLRTAITLRDLRHWLEEIAEIMDCPVGTVRSRIFRAWNYRVKCNLPVATLKQLKNPKPSKVGVSKCKKVTFSLYWWWTSQRELTENYARWRITAILGKFSIQ